MLWHSGKKYSANSLRFSLVTEAEWVGIGCWASRGFATSLKFQVSKVCAAVC